MREVQSVASIPPGAVRLVGVLAGEPLEDIPVSADVLESTGFKGEHGQTTVVHGSDGPVLLVGLGEQVGPDELREACGSAARVVPLSTPIATRLHSIDLEGGVEAVVQGLLLGSYRYDEYRSSDPSERAPICLVGEVDTDAVAAGVVVADETCRARDWINRTPADKSPAVLADEMGSVLAEVGLDVEIWDESRIAKERLGGLLGVAAGSDRRPRMLVATSSGRGGPRLALVGKGIVFDSGGLSIKPADSMTTMKGDMAGGAAVVAGASAISRAEIPVDLAVYVPLTDNMSGGSAIKPDDVVRIRNGRTIEVVNTDAEGRLVLADALCLATEAAPDLIVDVATLTGAARVALGERIAAVFASDEAVRDLVLDAASAAGERAWPLPLPSDYRSMIESPVADMKNTGGRYGGAITAAVLLAEFVEDRPWAHLDIAGPSYFREDRPLGPKGGAGYGVATLVSLARALARG